MKRLLMLLLCALFAGIPGARAEALEIPEGVPLLRIAKDFFIKFNYFFFNSPCAVYAHHINHIDVLFDWQQISSKNCAANSARSLVVVVAVVLFVLLLQQFYRAVKIAFKLPHFSGTVDFKFLFSFFDSLLMSNSSFAF